MADCFNYTSKEEVIVHKIADFLEDVFFITNVTEGQGSRKNYFSEKATEFERKYRRFIDYISLTVFDERIVPAIGEFENLCDEKDPKARVDLAYAGLLWLSDEPLMEDTEAYYWQ